jgi:hypothetical protein
VSRTGDRLTVYERVSCPKPAVLGVYDSQILPSCLNLPAINQRHLAIAHLSSKY